VIDDEIMFIYDGIERNSTENCKNKNRDGNHAKDQRIK
jgi:hypothetical protein